MNIRERLEAFWSGQCPDRIPYTIYWNEWRHTQRDPAWRPMLEAGLGISYFLDTCRAVTDATVQEIIDERTEGGQLHRRRILRAPVGNIVETFIDGWRQKFFLESAADYRVMRYIAEHTQITPHYAAYHDFLARANPWEIPQIFPGRTPMQVMHVDLAGMENLAMAMFEIPDEVDALFEALLRNYRKTIEIVAAGPGRFVDLLENFTAEFGPAYYAKYLLPVYRELLPMLHSAGKIVGVHYDGRLASCKELIADAPIDLIESLTPPPEGDMTLAEARAAFPRKRFWSNINVSKYELPPAQLREVVLQSVREAAVDGRLLAFEVSEQYPANWKTSMPIVLAALEETAVR